ncbi:MAG: glycosyltransferase family 4 protein [Gammaproteobacteria bacterium]
MKLALALFKYFPFGGVQRDCLRIAQVLQDRGHQVELLCIDWQGERPDNIPVKQLTVWGMSNHRRYRNFAKKARSYCRRRGVDGLIGFNKIAGLDVYFAADGCYRLKSESKSGLYRLTPRYKYFCADEHAVFGEQKKTHILALSKREMTHYQQTYRTPRSRFTLLPPGISADRKPTPDSAAIRTQYRHGLGVGEQQKLLLMVGSGFKTKGLDRALYALKSLDNGKNPPAKFVIIGKDNFDPFRKLANRMGLTEQVEFFPGRTDIPQLLQAADLLLHPAYYENSGMILLEALVAGLPVLTTEACGYAHYVSEADGGWVLPEPFDQSEMNRVLQNILSGDDLPRWRTNGIRFGKTADLFGLHDTAADVIERVIGSKLAATDRLTNHATP